MLAGGAAAAAGAFLHGSPASPPAALAATGAAVQSVGPGPVATVLERRNYRLEVSVRPNRAVVPNRFAVEVSRGGSPVRRARVEARFTMLGMEMGTQSYALPERSPGRYELAAPALVMGGRWQLAFAIRPAGGATVQVRLVDRPGG